MNVIIRLQGLAWTANASDIRQFFKGLQIPEGGVHIVGGEDGDAFIAFSTDEDARQAMSLTGGKIKEVRVSLLLSSRAEMQKVIEKARAASMLSMINKPSMQSLPSAEAFTNQFGRKLLPDNNTLVNAPQLMANYMQQQPPAAPIINFQQMKPNITGLNQTVPPNNMTVNAHMPMYYNSLNNSAEYLNYVKMANASGNLQVENKLLTQTSDIYSNNRFSRSSSRERQRSRSPHSRYDSDEKKERKRRTRFSSPESNKAVISTPVVPNNTTNILLQQQQQFQQQQAALLNVNNMANTKLSSSIWDVPPINLNAAYPNLNANNSSNFGNTIVAAATRNYQTSDQSHMPSMQQYQSNAFGSNNSNSGVGTCIKVANVDKETTYSDIRKFFNGFPIDDIKFLTDDKGNHSGVALIRFVSSDSKKQALTKNGWQLKSTQIMITSIPEDDYENGLDSSKLRNNSNKRNFDDPRRDRYNDRYSRDRSDSRERDYDRDRNRDRYNRNNSNNNNGNNRYDNSRNNRFNNNGPNGYRNNNNNQRDFRRDNDDKNYKNFGGNKMNEIPEEKIEYVPDENFTVLIIDDIPSKNEADLFEAFPNILNITIDKYTAYCKFKTHEAAKAVLENRFLHYIRNKRVFIETGSEAQFSDLVKKYGKFNNPEMKDEIDDSETVTTNENSVEDPEQSSSSSADDRVKKTVTSRDPRQRSQNANGNDRNNGASSNLNTDCVLIKNLEVKATIDDVEKFFSDVNIQRNNMRTHILLDKRGQPCGDCFIEFKFENDLQRALSKNNLMMGQNRIQIMPIPREQVEAVLSSFGSEDNSRSQNQNNQNRRDWAPPLDFGPPGCVLMISNLCYRATIDDILDEFREFDLKPDNIIRRYNDAGQPTGNACINFNSQSDAERALDEYNRVKILNRPIFLKLL